MKIVNLRTFLALPKGTLFASYHPCVAGDLCIKDENIAATDFCYVPLCLPVDCNDSGELFDLLDQAQQQGASLPIDLDCTTRHGWCEPGTLFLVWEPDDLISLVHRLERAWMHSTYGLKS